MKLNGYLLRSLDIHRLEVIKEELFSPHEYSYVPTFFRSPQNDLEISDPVTDFFRWA